MLRERFILTGMGIYVVRREVLDFIPHDYFDFPALASKVFELKKALIYLHNGYWYDLGTPEEYKKVCEGV